MNEEDIKSLIAIRNDLIEVYSKCKDYKSNKNAIMREVDHARIVHETVVKLDGVLAKYVSFN